MSSRRRRAEENHRKWVHACWASEVRDSGPNSISMKAVDFLAGLDAYRKLSAPVL